MRDGMIYFGYFNSFRYLSTRLKLFAVRTFYIGQLFLLSSSQNPR